MGSWYQSKDNVDILNKIESIKQDVSSTASEKIAQQMSEIDRIQNEKINLLKDNIQKIDHVLSLNKIDIEDKITKSRVDIQRLNTITQVQKTSISNLEDELIKFQKSNNDFYKKIKFLYFTHLIMLLAGMIAFYLNAR